MSGQCSVTFGATAKKATLNHVLSWCVCVCSDVNSKTGFHEQHQCNQKLSHEYAVKSRPYETRQKRYYANDAAGYSPIEILLISEKLRQKLRQKLASTRLAAINPRHLGTCTVYGPPGASVHLPYFRKDCWTSLVVDLAIMIERVAGTDRAARYLHARGIPLSTAVRVLAGRRRR